MGCARCLARFNLEQIVAALCPVPYVLYLAVFLFRGKAYRVCPYNVGREQRRCKGESKPLLGDGNFETSDFRH